MVREDCLAGYYIWRSGWTEKSNHFIIDCGPISNLISNPGHGHSDALSFELTVKGKPVFVNSGTYTYRNSRERSYFRGTLSHNTVTVDRLDQSELWSAFRVGKMANVHILKWQMENKCLLFSGYHDGYLRLNSRIIHRRDIALVENQFMVLRDTFSFQGKSNGSKIEQIFHLDPNCKIMDKDENLIIRYDNSNIVKIVPARYDDATVHVIRGENNTQFGWISESYYKMTPSTSLVYLLNNECSSSTLIFLFQDEATQNFPIVKPINHIDSSRGVEDLFIIQGPEDVYEIRWKGADYRQYPTQIIEAEGFWVK